MARFVFALRALLEQRRRQERDAQVIVAHIESQRLSLEDELRRIQKTIGLGKDELREALAGGHIWSGTPGSAPRGVVDAHGVRLQANASMHMGVKAQKVAITLAGVMTRLEEARGKLSEAMKHRRAIELVRDRRYEAWKREQAKRESAELDDLGMTRAARAVEGWM